MNTAFFHQVQKHLNPERLDAYREDGASEATTLARYLWNMALCETLYSPLQFAEIALRNELHTFLTQRYGTEQWCTRSPRLLNWQHDKLRDARNELEKSNRKRPACARKKITPGRMVAELNFGFWTAFFNKGHMQTGLGHAIVAQAFEHAPDSARDMKVMSARWKSIRELRNRVFHHERILHWKDLNTKHADILETIGWINPELEQLARMLDRFTQVRQDGLTPWLDKLRNNWPAN